MKLNGEEMLLEGTQTLADFLARRNYDCRRVAVERNGEIVPKAKYGSVILSEEDTLEVVSFVGGG